MPSPPPNPGAVQAITAAGHRIGNHTATHPRWQRLNAQTEPQAIRSLVDRVASPARPGEIVLMQVGSHPNDHTTLDAAALPTVIDRLRADGYRFVTLDALLHDRPHRRAGKVTSLNS